MLELIPFLVLAAICFIVCMRVLNMIFENKTDYWCLIPLTVGQAFVLIPVITTIKKMLLNA